MLDVKEFLIELIPYLILAFLVGLVIAIIFPLVIATPLAFISGWSIGTWGSNKVLNR